MITTKTALSNKSHESTEPVLITDNELIGKYLFANDAEALEELVRRHSGMIMGVCSSLLLNSHDAEDAFQSTFLILSRKAKSLINHGSIAGWLYQVAIRNCLQIRRRKGRAKEIEMTKEPAQSKNEPWHSISQVQECDLIFQEINRLPKRYRDVIVLCHLEGRSRQETAELLECTESSVKAALARARNQLRRRLIRSGMVTSAMLLMLRESTVSAAELVSEPLIGSTVQICQGQTPTAPFGSSPEFIQQLANQGVMTMQTTNIIKSISATVCLFLLAAVPAVVIGQQLATSGLTSEPIQLSSSDDEEPNTDSISDTQIRIASQETSRTSQETSLSTTEASSLTTTTESVPNQSVASVETQKVQSEFERLGIRKFDIENSEEYWGLMMKSYESRMAAIQIDLSKSDSDRRSTLQADAYELKAKVVEAKLNIQRIETMKQHKLTFAPVESVRPSEPGKVQTVRPIESSDSRPIPNVVGVGSLLPKVRPIESQSTRPHNATASTETQPFQRPTELTPIGSTSPVRPGESLLVEFIGDTGLDRRVTVQADNTIRLPLVGTISVEDLTPSQIEEVVDIEFAEFMRDPNSFVSRESMSSPAPNRNK